MCLVLFWFFRSQEPGGDGDLIVRFTESGAWAIKSEFFGQAVFQAAYKVVKPMGYDGRVALHVMTCLAGFFTAAGFFRTLRVLGPPMPWLGIGLFAASGIVRLCFGHMEYYAWFLAMMTLWNVSAIRFLRGEAGGLQVGLWFSLGVWFHQGFAFALPALLILPYLARRGDDFPKMLMGLWPVAVLIFFRKFPLLSPISLEGHSHNLNYVPFVLEPDGEWLYTMFSWAHLADILHASALRAVLAWPLLGIVFLLRTKKLFWTPDRITVFLLVQWAGFLFFVVTWHPNLGIPADWDLFAIEALPVILLLAHLLPSLLAAPAPRYALAAAIGFCCFFTWNTIGSDARLRAREFCAIKVVGEENERLRITVDGRYRDSSVPALLPGRHAVKVICADRSIAFNYPVVLHPGAELSVYLPRMDEEYDPVAHGVGWTTAAPAGRMPEL